MSVVLPAGPGPWTVDDLPESTVPVELVDGKFVVNPAPAPRHQLVSARLVALLDRLGFAGRVVAASDVIFDPHNSRQPDVLVAAPGVDLWDGPALTPQEIVLAVEIVSPSSVTTDRVLKPAQYAAAGIGGYWRIDIEPRLVLTAYVLQRGDDVYTETGTWTHGERVTLAEPLDVTFELTELRR